MYSSIKMSLAIVLLFSTFNATANQSISPETGYILNTFLFLFCGVLVMLMAAGFTMLEAGSVRNKSVAVILTKNITLYPIAGIAYYLVGYNLMYSGVDGGLIGTFGAWAPDDSKALAGDFLSINHATTANWFFQMVFVATTASIVSGALAERIKIWPFIGFVVILTSVIYPITGSWTWGGGWLSSQGFSDFAGSTIVHSVGGWAALIGAILLGPRRGRFPEEGGAQMLPGSNLAQVTLGTFILWFGWFGFNGGSQLAMGSGNDAIAIANIIANTNAAAAGGVVAVMALSYAINKRLNLPMILNGALAGLVSITAEPLMPSIGQATMIGAVGGIIMMGTAYLLERSKIDDVVGAIPVHLAAGIWGTIIVPYTNPSAHLLNQIIGVLSIGLFVCAVSFIIWGLFKVLFGIRIHWNKESNPDLAEIGVEAYQLHFSENYTGKSSEKL